jgi:hypothetical protein
VVAGDEAEAQQAPRERPRREGERLPSASLSLCLCEKLSSAIYLIGYNVKEELENFTIELMATFVSTPIRNSYRDFPPPPAVSHNRFSERFCDFGILEISGRGTLHSDFSRNARP